MTNQLTKFQLPSFVIVFLFINILSAESFDEIVKKISNSYLYKLSKNEVELSKKSLEVAKSLNYGKVNLSYMAIHTFERPTMKLTTTTPVEVAPDGTHLIYQTFNTDLPMSDKNHYIGEIKYSYPLFSGFAIVNSIEKAKINLIKTKLKLKNTKRVLILNTAKLYAGIYALNQEIKALNFAKSALNSAREKVRALFNEGLVDKSEVYEIDAKYYEILAKIKKSVSKRDNLINTLSSLLNQKVVSIGLLPSIKLKKNLNPKNRPDVKEIAKNLDIAEISEKLAKSSFYPKIGFELGLKREADNFILNKNDYQNIDKSYAGVGINWNLFNGGADRAKLEMAKISKLNALIYYKNYLNQAKVELQNDLNTLVSLKYQFKAAIKEVEARLEFYEKIKSKFNEGLVDSVDLSEAIAKLAESKAKKDYIDSQIFFYTLKANLDGGDDISFQF